MTLTITEAQFYMGIIVVLMGMQIYLHITLMKVKKETDKLWDQIAILATALSVHLAVAEKEQKEKQDKE